MRGFLSCKGAKDRGSKRSWCVLMDRIIYFYKASEDVAAVKTMPVLGWKLSQVGRNVKGSLFQLMKTITFQKSTTDFVLEHPALGKTVFSAPDEGSFGKWFAALAAAVDATTL